MRKLHRLLAILTSLALLASLAGTAAAETPTGADRGHQTDNIESPLSEKQSALKQAAFEAVLSGEVTPRGDNKVVKVAKGQYVELAFEGEDQILTLLGEFGTGDDPTHGGTRNHVNRHDPDNNATNGPLHNQIPQPNRAVDNTTIWTADFSQSYYDNLLYNKGANPSMANYYLEQSSGTYSVDGYASDWVQVDFNAANYGSDYCDDIVCQDTWFFVQEQANTWWDVLVAEKGSVAAANAFLTTFDVWDRYDYNGNGDFDEPDGYIDHFQSVHAGEGEETGGGAQGSDAIWSHRWYVQLTAIGAGGPAGNPLGGTRIGTSNYWIGDYTIEPENGGVGVFAHEFAHDLGLPDLYDTSGNTGGAENSTGWWTIMSQGSYGSVNGQDIGSSPTHFGAWEKFQLGFLNNFTVAFPGDSGTYNLGPAEYNTKKPQAMFIVLPDKQVTRELGAPYEGASFYYSGTADNLNTTMTRSVALPAGSVTLSAKVRYNIEVDYDYAYLMVNGTKVATNLSNSSVVSEGIDGVAAGWVDLTANLSSYAGQTVTLGFGFMTDGGVQGQDPDLPAGFSIDNIQVTGQPLDGAETNAGWTFTSNTPGVGFHVTTGTETFEFFNAYVLENRQYIGYDLALKKGPYNFGFPATPDLVEHFPLQDGLLISYWDNSQSDNNVGDHPGEGLILPVDSHPGIETWTEGTQMRPRIQSYDSTFTTTKTDAITLHNPATGVAKTIASKPGTSVFNDSLRDGDGTSIYWAPGHPSDAAANGRYQAEWNSVDVPNTGTVVRVKSISSTGMMVLDLNK